MCFDLPLPHKDKHDDIHLSLVNLCLGVTVNMLSLKLFTVGLLL